MLWPFTNSAKWLPYHFFFRPCNDNSPHCSSISYQFDFYLCLWLIVDFQEKYDDLRAKGCNLLGTVLNYLCFLIPFLLIQKVIIPFLIFFYENCLLLGGHQRVALMRCYHCFYSMPLGLFRFAFSTVSLTSLLSIFCCLYRKRVLVCVATSNSFSMNIWYWAAS